MTGHEEERQVMAVSRLGTKINSSDPPLPAVRSAYPAPPFLPFFHPPIELASARPRGRVHLDRRINLSAICCGKLLQVGVAEVHNCSSTWLPALLTGAAWSGPRGSLGNCPGVHTWHVSKDLPPVYMEGQLTPQWLDKNRPKRCTVDLGELERAWRVKAEAQLAELLEAQAK